MKNIKKVLSVVAVAVLITGQSVYAQNSTSPLKPVQAQQAKGQVSENNIKSPESPSLKLFLNPSNPLGLVNAENSINKTMNLMQKNRLVEAKIIIEPLMDWLEDVTEYHTNLYKVLKEIDTAKAQADLERDLALKSAILRDKASYQLALLYIEEKNPRKAVSRLVDVVRSQPRTQLGFSAYQVLQQIGFTYKVQLIETDQANPEAGQIVK